MSTTRWSVDPEGWQTAVVGFWEHLWSPEVLQHRILLLLTALQIEIDPRVRGVKLQFNEVDFR